MKNRKYNFGKCGIIKEDKIIVCQEKKSKFIGENINKEKILEVTLDGCLNINGKICDFLLINTNKNSAHFIELKGQDIKHAVKQLENTIKITENIKNNYIKTKFTEKKSYAVLTRCPIGSKDLNNLKRKFRKETKSVLIIKNKQINAKL